MDADPKSPLQEGPPSAFHTAYYSPSFCADDVRDSMPLFRSGRGGATPTSALQLRMGKIPRERFLSLNRQWHSRLPECGNCWMGNCYEAHFNDIAYAVAWWSHPVNNHLTDGKTWELRRMAVAPDAPKNTASRFLRIMVMMLKREMPHLRKLVSYQDCAVHAGTIYKAAGWTPNKTSNRTAWSASKRGRKPGPADGTEKVRWELILCQENDTAEGCPP